MPAPGDRAPDALPSRWPDTDRFIRSVLYAAPAVVADDEDERDPSARRVSAFDAMVGPLLRDGKGVSARDADLVACLPATQHAYDPTATADVLTTASERHRARL